MKNIFVGCAWIAAIYFLFILKPAEAELAVILTDNPVYIIQDDNLWSKLDEPLKDFSYLSLKQRFNKSKSIVPTLIDSSGDYITTVALKNQGGASQWHLVFNANFIDKGIAYWAPDNGLPVRLDEFSQLVDSGTPSLLHYQTTSLPIAANETGELLIYVQAQQFTYPLSIEILNPSAFSKKQFILNTVSVMAISIMLTLAVISLALFVRTGYPVTIACAGYIGLHGIGWAAASGLLDDIFVFSNFNTTYGGIFIFPLAIASASQFTKLLFNCDDESPKIAYYLNILTLVCLAFGLILPWVSFHQAFIISHSIGTLWIPITLFIGFYMLKKGDFRAKYYLFGNLVYTLSLAFYMLTHFHGYTGELYPELVVVSALSVDCICILLSLTEWLKNQQSEYSQNYNQARIDPLTNIGNRYALNEQLARVKGNSTLVFIDLDGMKLINDTLGHEKGDLLLKDTARLMSKKINPWGKVFRTGGDEFIWVIGLSCQGTLNNIKKLIDEVELELRTQGWLEIGISFGFASTSETKTISECLILADQRMYEHKQGKQLGKILYRGPQEGRI